MIDACTIIAGNYLAGARVLADSFFTHHPDGRLTILIVDDEARAIVPDEPGDRRVTWWRLADLGLDTAEIHRLAGIYDVMELATSLKPLLLQQLVRARGSAVIYLDPDIRVHGSLAHVAVLAEAHGLVLTPHITAPFPEDDRQVDALFVLAAGVYNLGFAAVGPAGAACLDWWWAQTRRRALNDVTRQMFTDQRWADYLPSLFSHHLLKDPGYNVAYWNLHERPVTRTQGRHFARNAPLRFFHFSGFDPRMPWLLSRHQGERPRILLSEHPVLAALCDEYAAALDRAGFEASSRRAYGWDVTADGLELSGRIRRLYWSAVMAAERGEAPEPPDPFDTARPSAFTDWLNAPVTSGARPWSRYLHALFEARPDVQAHVRDIGGADALFFANWVLIDGIGQERIRPALLPPDLEAFIAEASARRANPGAAAGANGAGHVQAAPLPRGLNVAGYFHAELGVGEAARLLTHAIEATGDPFATMPRHAPLSRHRHPFERRGSDAATPFDVNLLCVNADATDAFARDAGPAFFSGRYTIGYWFWEVDPLPPAMHAAFAHVDEVWTATEYVAAIVRAASGGRTPVYTVPLPLLLPSPEAAESDASAEARRFTRARLGLPADRFLFLFIFDFLSVMERKNPLGLIEAFRAAFAPGEGPVLVLKSINGTARVAELEQLRRAAADRADILIRDGYVDADEKGALLSACDAYVSLHRAEGLGLTLAEAMARGRPTIATGYSGNRHFMTDDNSFLVRHTMARAAEASGPYPPGARWAEPDLAHAARLMRAVVEQPGEAARRAERARADLLFRHDVMSSASVIAERLASIRRERETAAGAAVATGVAGAIPSPPAPSPQGEGEDGAAPAPMVGNGAHASAPNLPAAAEARAAFAAALPNLRALGEPRLSRDDRAWPRLRRAAQRAMFRVIRPYWFQQRQFQEALLDAVEHSLARLDGAADRPASPDAAPDTTDRQS